ncbi:MAG: redoxin domain-containing protein [Terracidiphilus sp.]|nr:redoxin domain-containing protein [Terracidiphilus sp.]
MPSVYEAARIHSILRNCLVAFLAASLGTASLSAHPQKGAPAPPLNSLTLLQAPTGASASWTSLKGKVVVLEFWATWCSPCVASLPHINQLIAALDPAKFQFISIDDEDRKDIQTFLTKKKTSGWIGVDPDGKIFTAYGVTSRPTTVIIDGHGKIVAVTEIDSVSTADLEAVAAGKNVAFKPAFALTVASAPSKPDAAPALFSFSIGKAAPGAKSSTVEHPPTGADFLGADADGLLTDVLDVFKNRYIVEGTLPEGRYNLHMNYAAVPQKVATPLIQQAVLAALHLQIQPKTFTRRAYILRATDASKNLLSPSASTRATKRGNWHNGYILMNGTMDDLAYILATGLETPVLNETGIGGAYDARFQAAGKDIDSLNAVLKKELGLELVPGDQELPITVLEISKQEENKPDSPTKAPEAKH